MGDILRSLYPPILPYDIIFIPVSDIHTIHVEQCGNPKGQPVLFLHGGPGGGFSARDRRYFDPSVYRIILIDQRGAGKSTPTAELTDNDTWRLVEDIETIRIKLDIERWAVFGGSWGSTLSLTYAIMHPTRIKALILRGIFMLRQSELHWFYQDGASHIFPDYWDGFIAPIPVAERGDLIKAYYSRLTGSDELVKLECAKAWSKWECATSLLIPNQLKIKEADEDEWALTFARIECHYFTNKGFFPTDQYILENANKLKGIPAVIVQGRYDVVCPMKSAYDLKKAWPEAQLIIVSIVF